jgi:putative phosphonate metabolism protein
MTSPGRYALYFAPAEDSAIWRFGIGWLGRDPVSGAALPQPQVPGLTAAQLAAATESPRNYGFHATLKPPFHLADGTGEADVRAAARAFAAARRAFIAPPVSLQRIGRFQAFALTAPCAEMDGLAADCVSVFDAFRAPPSAAELAKRRARGLTERQERYLQQWGYPYVMEEFRFHMTMLGSSRDETLHAAVTAFLAPQAAGFALDPLPVDAICLYQQETRSAPFRLVERFSFQAA